MAPDLSHSSVRSSSSHTSSANSLGSKGPRSVSITSTASGSANKSSGGFSFYIAGFFIVAQLGGAGFVSLPSALAHTGWLGLPMMILFCFLVGFSATRLGYCYNILEERWPEQYSLPARQPYMEIADRAFGKHGRAITLFCVVASQFGGTTVFIILIAEMLNSLITAVSICEWVLIVGLLITPFTWLGTPNDFWIGPMIAVVSTVLACVVIIVQALLDAPDVGNMVQHVNPSVTSFALGFSSIAFAYSGVSVFPTIQNDMVDRTQFWKSIIIGFACILTLYIPVSSSGYAVYGTDVDTNILFSVPQGIAVTMAMSLQIINLLGSYVIGFSTVTQATEDILNIPKNFNWKRIVCRTFTVWLEVLICLAIPDFSLILNLIGGSTMTVCSFILPPLMYMKLASSGPLHTQRKIPLWMKIALIEIVIIGSIGGLLSTITAVYAIITTPFSSSCFIEFTKNENISSISPS
uniref:Proton-coupled amino acid transporter 2-like n=1 Tax=Hirondellea gigas TaxID=1518452 RepID=A0A6A7G403_9CRUS